ncbi:MAG: DUF1566 domain-containing protein [Deltaproteobacteria bacterium]|nr:DUF1566 domain-containing protein [Deltaproteobacteria bacterium]
MTVLVWQGCPGGTTGSLCNGGALAYMNWKVALEYCESLNWSNKDDWRLPSINELSWIVDSTKTDPALDTAVFPGPSLNYASATTKPKSPDSAFYLQANLGYAIGYTKSQNIAVRCVRDGP